MAIEWLLAALFLPLFPFSSIVVLILGRLDNAWLRALVVLAWPQAGVYALTSLSAERAGDIPAWLGYWAILTSLLYALRSLVLRDLVLWVSFIAVSTWSLLWLVSPLLMQQVLMQQDIVIIAVALSLPLALAMLLSGEMMQRFHAAYAGLPGGIATVYPVLSGLLVFSVLAIVATPVFPAFFTMLALVMAQLQQATWLAVGLVVSWFFWTWSGMRLLQGVLTGPKAAKVAADVSPGRSTLYILALLSLAGLGIYLTRMF